MSVRGASNAVTNTQLAQSFLRSERFVFYIFSRLNEEGKKKGNFHFSFLFDRFSY